MKRRRKKDVQKSRTIALERIKTLFEQAKKEFKTDKNLSNRYVKLAWKISLKNKVKIPSELKKRFCKHCLTYLVPPVTCRVRTGKKRITYCCLNCKRFMRFPFKKKEQK